MPRSGRCRCGQLLRFERTARGYKTRCPKCQAVVRLRDPGERTGPTAAHAEGLAETVDYTGPDDLGVLGFGRTAAPVALADLPVYAGPAPAAPRASWPRGMLAAVALAVVVAVGAVAALLSL